MTDKYEDLIRRLRSLHIMDEVGSDNPLGRDAADAIKELVADLAAAREALRIMRERVEKADEFLVADGHGEGSRVRECLADAIAAARAEKEADHD